MRPEEKLELKLEPKAKMETKVEAVPGADTDTDADAEPYHKRLREFDGEVRAEKGRKAKTRTATNAKKLRNTPTNQIASTNRRVSELRAKKL